ncbi:MAG: hypothetical protein HY822_17175 [Acidobacteria bacterium]|nr:hypothetical protein [Acidobacteriota bacterium]
MLNTLSMPECCWAENLDGGACPGMSAHHLARVCAGMENNELRNVFGPLSKKPPCKSKEHSSNQVCGGRIGQAAGV